MFYPIATESLWGQVESALRLTAGSMPAEVRALDDGRAVVLYRGAFRGYAPAGASGVEVRASDGAVLFERSVGLDVPDATIITLLDATLTTNGQLVASLVAARPGAGTAHVLAYYTLTAKPTIRLVTASVACFRLSSAADQGLWCLGPHVQRHNSGNTDFQFLHHFSEDGRLLKSIGDRAAFPGVPTPWDNRSHMLAAGTTLTLWMAGRKHLVRFDTSGQLLSAAPIPTPPILDDPRTGFALSTDGQLFVLGVTKHPSQDLESWRQDLFVLSGPTWTQTRLRDLSLAIRLVGAFPDRMALWDRGLSQVVRVKP